MIISVAREWTVVALFEFLLLLSTCSAQNSTASDSQGERPAFITPLLGGALALSILINCFLLALYCLRRHHRKLEDPASNEKASVPAAFEQCRAEASQDETLDRQPVGSDEFISQSAEPSVEFLQEGRNDEDVNYDVVEFPPHPVSKPEPKPSRDDGAGYSIPRNTGDVKVSSDKKVDSHSKLSIAKPPIKPRPRLSSSFSTPNLASGRSSSKAGSLPQIIVATDEDSLKDVRRNAVGHQGKGVKPRKYSTAPQATARIPISPSASSDKVGIRALRTERNGGSLKPLPPSKVKFPKHCDQDDYVDMDSIDTSYPAFLRTDSTASYVSMHSTGIGHLEPSSMANHAQASFCLASDFHDEDAHHLGGSSQLSDSSSGDANGYYANCTN